MGLDECSGGGGDGGEWLSRVGRLKIICRGCTLSRTRNFAPVTPRSFAFVITVASLPIASAKCLRVGCAKTRNCLRLPSSGKDKHFFTFRTMIFCFKNLKVIFGVFKPISSCFCFLKIINNNIPEQIPETDFEMVLKSLEVERSGWGVEPVDTFQPGTRAGLHNLEQFVEKRLKGYGSSRNDPNAGALSNISPWVNTGQVPVRGSDPIRDCDSVQRVFFQTIKPFFGREGEGGKEGHKVKI